MIKKFRTHVSQIDESVMRIDSGTKLSLYKKSKKYGIGLDILEEVYSRGYNSWDPIVNKTPDQYAFDRVNSFLSGGYAVELDNDIVEERGLWDNIHAKQERIKHGSGEKMRKPGSKGAPTSKDFKDSQVKEGLLKKLPHDDARHFKNNETSELQSHDPNDPDSRFDGTTSGKEVYSSETPGQKGYRSKSPKQVVKSVVREKLENICSDCTCGLLEDWQKSKYKNPEGGLTQAGVDAYRREHPGSHLKTAVTTEPSKLKAGSKDANRRKSFCARMGGMKKRLTSAKTANDPDSRINKSLRKWHCEDVEEIVELNVRDAAGVKHHISKVAIRMANGKIEMKDPGKSGSSGGGGK